MKTKLIYLLTSLFLFTISVVFIYLSAEPAAPLYNFITYTTVGFGFLISAIILAVVAFCTTIHALVRFFQKEDSSNKSWLEREKEAAMDMGRRLIRLRMFGGSFVFHLGLGIIVKGWVLKNCIQLWEVAYGMSLIILDIAVLVWLIQCWKKESKGASVIAANLIVIIVGFCFGFILFR